MKEFDNLHDLLHSLIGARRSLPKCMGIQRGRLERMIDKVLAQLEKEPPLTPTSPDDKILF